MKDQFLISTDHPVLRDHVVHGRHVMPGLAYVDLVFQFLRSAGHAFEDWELRDLSIYEPLVVGSDKPALLTVESSRNPDNSLRILIQSESGAVGKGGAIRHVVVQALRVKSGPFVERIDPASIKRAGTAIDVSKIYERYAALGLEHGPFMRVCGTVYVADGAVYSDVSLRGDALEAASETLFSPALLDGSAVCGSVGLAYANASVNRRLSLPVYLNSFRACTPLQRSCIARLRVDSVRSRSDVSYLTLEFFDSTGLKVAELRDLAGTSGLKQQAELQVASTGNRVIARAPANSEVQRQLSMPERIEQLLCDWFAERGHPLPDLADTDISFAELGMDSTGLLQLLQDLEVRMGTSLSPTLLFEYGNIRELAAYLAANGLVAPDSDASGTAPADSQEAPAAAIALAAGAAALAQSAPDEPPLSEDLEHFLRGFFAERLGIPVAQLNCEANFSDLGFDSTALLSLLQGLEGHIGAGLPPVLLFEYRTITELTQYLIAHHGASLRPWLLAATAPDGSHTIAPADAVECSSIAPSKSEPAISSSQPRQLPSTGAAPEAIQLHRGGGEQRGRAGACERDIAIVALSGRFPGASSMDELWEVLRTGKDCITEIPLTRWDYRKYLDYEERCRWGAIEFCHWGGFMDDVDEFDASFFNIQPAHAACMDPQERLFLQTVWQLLESGGYTRQRIREDHGGRVGVYVGAMYHDYSHIESDVSQELGSFLSFHSSIANRVSHFFDLNGPSLALDTMCSSSAVALHTACRDLSYGDCELAIVGGVNLSLHHKKFIGLSHEKQIGSRDTSRSFSSADGYLPAEAIGAVLLKPLAKAIEGRDRILGVIKSTATNHSGRSNGFTVPNPTAQADVIERCLAAADIDPRTISYVEATASGSSLGDPIELVALHRVFSKHGAASQVCPIGTVKSNIGHAEAASAMTQLAKLVLQFEHRQLPQSIKTEPLNPLAQWADTAFHLVPELQEWRPPSVEIEGEERLYPRRAILNSFGAGGTNVSMVLEEYIPAPVEEPRSVEPSGRAEIVVFSARTADRLPWMLRQTLEHLRRNPQSLEDIAYTLQLGREAMEARLALVVNSREELMTVLEKSLSFDPEHMRCVPANLPLFFGDRKEDAGKGAGPAKSDKALIELLIEENDAYRLALLWTQGANVPWRRLHANRAARIVPLPTYPFKKERHWLSLREHTGRVDPIEQPRVAEADREPTSDAQALIRSIELNFGERNGVAPRNKVERAIADIWEEALGIDDVGVTDNFFELGGNSLSAGLVIARCAETFNVDIDWMILLGQEPTISTFAVTIVSKLANGMNERELEAALAN